MALRPGHPEAKGQLRTAGVVRRLQHDLLCFQHLLEPATSDQKTLVQRRHLPILWVTLIRLQQNGFVALQLVLVRQPGRAQIEAHRLRRVLLLGGGIEQHLHPLSRRIIIQVGQTGARIGRAAKRMGPLVGVHRSLVILQITCHIPQFGQYLRTLRVALGTVDAALKDGKHHLQLAQVPVHIAGFTQRCQHLRAQLPRRLKVFQRTWCLQQFGG